MASSLKRKQSVFPQVKSGRGLPFVSKKIIALAIAILLITFFIGQNSFLGTESPESENEAILQYERQSGNATIGSDGETATDSGFSTTNNTSSDFFVGPVRLPNSGFITEELDKASNEIAANNVSDPSQSGAGENSFSFSNFAAHPLQTIADVAVEMKNSWINNGRKDTLIKLVDSISRYYLSFNRFPSPETMIADEDYDWVREMVDKREMSGVYEYVLKTTAPVAYCGTPEQTGYCFKTDGQNAIVYVRFEKQADSEICDGEGLFFLWSSEDNKLGMVCLFEEPVKLGGFHYLRYL